MINDEYFKKWLDDRLSHIENKLDEYHKDDQKRLSDVEGRVNELETHKDKSVGMWKAYGKTATLAGGITGGVIAWITNRFF